MELSNNNNTNEQDCVPIDFSQVQEKLSWKEPEYREIVMWLLSNDEDYQGLAKDNIFAEFSLLSEGRSSVEVLRLAFKHKSSQEEKSRFVIRVSKTENAKKEENAVKKLRGKKHHCFATIRKQIDFIKNYSAILYDSVEDSMEENVYNLSDYIISTKEIEYFSKAFHNCIKAATKKYEDVSIPKDSVTEGKDKISSLRYFEHILRWLPPDFIITDYQLNNDINIEVETISISQFLKKREEWEGTKKWFRFQEEFDEPLSGNDDNNTIYLPLKSADDIPKIWLEIDKNKYEEIKSKPLVFCNEKLVEFAAKFGNKICSLSNQELKSILQQNQVKFLAVKMRHTDLHCGNVLV